ncbi:TRAP transporter large permease [Thermodesulfobacteriota bacterium]
METSAVGLGTVVIFLLLIFAGQRISIAGFVSGFIGLVAYYGWQPAMVSTVGHIFSESIKYGLTVIPLFTLMGFLAFWGGIGDEIYTTTRRWVGQYPGGLAMATTLGCAGFGAITGSSTAAAIMFAKLAIPEMDKYKYKRKLSIGTVVASGTLATLIPPSLSIMIYGLLTEQSIGKLFIAGFIPGIFSAFIYCAFIYVWSIMSPDLAPRGPISTFKEKLASLRHLWSTVVIMLAVLTGLYTGVFTPTEAGAMGAFCIFLVVTLKGKFTWKLLKGALLETARMCSMCFVILLGVRVLMTALVATGVTAGLTEFMLGSVSSPFLILMAILAIYMIFGCFIGGIGMMVVTIPLVSPVTIALGYDPIWFGIIVAKMVEIALITPPVGVNAFVVSKVTNVPLEQTFRSVLPFFFMDLFTIALLIAFPQIVLFLPSHM